MFVSVGPLGASANLLIDGGFDNPTSPVSFPTAVDRFITLWEIAGDMMEDPIIREATDALKAGSGVSAGTDGHALAEANKELLTLHELIAHRLVQLLLGLHRGRKIFA